MKSAEFRFTEPSIDCDNENAFSGLLLRAIQALNDRDRRGVNHILNVLHPGSDAAAATILRRASAVLICAQNAPCEARSHSDGMIETCRRRPNQEIPDSFIRLMLKW